METTGEQADGGAGQPDGSKSREDANQIRSLTHASVLIGGFKAAAVRHANRFSVGSKY